MAVKGNSEDFFDQVAGKVADTDNFFEDLERDVNSLVQDSPEEAAKQTTSQTGNPAKTEKSVGSQPSEVDNLKKRYSDSSREAQNLRAQLNQLKPFVPVLDAMKQDSGLVEHVKDYFKDGGQVNKTIKDQLKLDENFVFDPDEMVGDENSDSRKVFNAMVNKIVDKKANQIVGNLDAEAAKDAHNAKLDAQAQAFIQKNGLTKQEFMSFVQEAQHKFSTQGMSFDDMWLIVNKNKAANNIANSTKQDMLNQMKGVRNIPTSQSSSNNAGKPNNVNDDVFDALLGSDGNIEELLG